MQYAVVWRNAESQKTKWGKCCRCVSFRNALGCCLPHGCNGMHSLERSNNGQPICLPCLVLLCVPSVQTGYTWGRWCRRSQVRCRPAAACCHGLLIPSAIACWRLQLLPCNAGSLPGPNCGAGGATDGSASSLLPCCGCDAAGCCFRCCRWYWCSCSCLASALPALCSCVLPHRLHYAVTLCCLCTANRLELLCARGHLCPCLFANFLPMHCLPARLPGWLPAAIGFNVETVTYKNIKFQVGVAWAGEGGHRGAQFLQPSCPPCCYDIIRSAHAEQQHVVGIGTGSCT